MDSLIGHDLIQEYFQRVISHGRLSHAYCFTGESSLGKRTFALDLAAQLMKKEEAALSTHPDMVLIEQELNEKTGKTKKHIDIAQIRSVTTLFSRHAAMGGYTIAIIDGAEKMNAAASNALLKTLEEPPKKSLLILITQNEQLLLPTIRSRCQRIAFSPVSDTQLMQTLGAREGTDLVSQVDGKPGLLMQLLQDADARDAFLAARSEILDLFGQPLYRKLETVETYFGDKTDHIAAREMLITRLEAWQSSLRKAFSSGTVSCTPYEYVLVQEKIDTTRKALRENIHPRLLVEDILLSIP